MAFKPVKNDNEEVTNGFPGDEGYVASEIVTTSPKSTKLVTSQGEFTFTESQLKDMSYAELVSQMGVANADDALGEDQFGPIMDKATKNRLVGVPMLLLKWEFHKGVGAGGEFVSAYVLTQTKERYIINDGGTGIHDQLKAYTERTGRNAMLQCERGLSRSDYDHPEFGPSTTYYIDSKLMA